MRLSLLALALALSAAMPAHAETRGDAWWRHVEVLAADDMNGRLTGTADFDRAAAYVVERFKAAGLSPAGTDGFLQPIALEEQYVDQDASHAALVAGGVESTLKVDDDMVISAGSPRPEAVDAPLIFAGYGLHLPEAGHNDFAGLDLKGKILVVISGGPAHLSGALKSHARSERARMAASRGAIGILTLNTPKAVEIPWPRVRQLARQPGMYLANAALRELRGAFVGGSIDPVRAERWFAASGHSFSEIAALADASAPVPTFALNQSLRGRIVSRRAPVHAYNILAILPGSDPKVARETVVVSAHLDHLGIGGEAGGDRNFNGAMDNASGVAAVLEIAKDYHARGLKPRRSILFAIVTGEEKGLLGSNYLARRTPRASGTLVADFNFDMPLPLWPLKSVIVLGAGESSLGKIAAAVGETMNLTLAPDPMPDRNSFIRSDQYSFVRAGIPAVAFKFGFGKDTREAAIEKEWRATRYHSPSDDLHQAVEKDDMVRLNDYVAAFVSRVADAPDRPSWNSDSFFRRFAVRNVR